MARLVAAGLAWLMVVGPLQAAPRARMVSAGAVDARLEEAARLRADRIQTIREAMAMPLTQQEAARRGVKLDRMAAMVPHLNDAELADLAQRAKSAKDLVAGHRHHGDDDAVIIVGVVLLIAGLVLLASVVDWDDYYDDCYCY
jgi:hypothetical protein